MEALCPKCRKVKHLTKHHYRPKRFFRRSDTIRLCRGCHSELEMLIPQFEKKSVRFYYQIVKIFLEGGGCGGAYYNDNLQNLRQG